MERAVLLERGARGRQPDGVGEIGVGRGPGHDRDAVCQARVLSGKERERCPDRNADQADAPAACVGPGGGGPHDAGRRRHLLDDYLPAGEAGRVGHENEEARAGEAAREPLYVGVPAAAGGHAVEEGEHGPRLPPPGRTTVVAADDALLRVRRVRGDPRHPPEHRNLHRDRKHLRGTHLRSTQDRQTMAEIAAAGSRASTLSHNMPRTRLLTAHLPIRRPLRAVLRRELQRRRSPDPAHHVRRRASVNPSKVPSAKRHHGGARPRRGARALRRSR